MLGFTTIRIRPHKERKAVSITTRTKEGVTIADVGGRLTAGGEVALYKTVQGLLDRGVTKILLNLQGVDLMDSTGLGELVRAEKATRSKGAALKLAQVPAGVQQTLALARLENEFQTFSSEADALASFRS
jgi:anti-anti-sigma factor